MSGALLALIGGGAGVSDGGPSGDGGDGGDGTTPPSGPIAVYPTTSDARILALRPNGRRIATLTVDPAFPLTSTNFHDLGSAIDAAKTIQQTSQQMNSVTFAGYAHPDYRVDIFVTPKADGSAYVGTVGLADFINIIGVTGNRGDVVFQDSTDSGGVFHAYGSAYLEGITLLGIDRGGLTDSTQGPKYALHVTLEEATLVLANCALYQNSPVSPAFMGMDGGSNATLHLYDVDCRDGNGNAVTNLHGANGNYGPVTIVYEDCPTVTHPSFSAGTDTGDQIYALGTTGTDFSGVSGDVTTHTSGDPGTAHALSARQQDKMLPSYVAGPFPVERAHISDTTMHPVVGRTYYVPVPMDGSFHATGTFFNVSTASGKWAQRPMATSHETDTPPLTFSPNLDPSTGPLLTIGDNYADFYYFSTLSEINSAWTAVTFSSASAVIPASTTIADDLPCWYTDDGTTLHRATSGTTFPVAGLRSAK